MLKSLTLPSLPGIGVSCSPSVEGINKQQARCSKHAKSTLHAKKGGLKDISYQETTYLLYSTRNLSRAMIGSNVLSSNSPYYLYNLGNVSYK